MYVLTDYLFNKQAYKDLHAFITNCDNNAEIAGGNTSTLYKAGTYFQWQRTVGAHNSPPGAGNRTYSAGAPDP